MQYLPAIDSSTLYFASYALDVLKNDPMVIKNGFQKINKHLKKGKKDYDLLISIIAELNGGVEKNDGTWNMKGFDDNIQANGNRFINFVFALLCLSKVIESICLGDQVFYLRGCTGTSIKEFEAFYFDYENQLKWEEPSINFPEQTKAYEEFLSQNHDFLNLLYGYAPEILTKDYFELGALLNDVSAGITSNPVAAESYSPFEKSLRIHSNALVKYANTSRLSRFTNLVTLSRYWGYLEHGLFYQFICEQHKIHYIWNDYRSPFLFALFGEDISNKTTVENLINLALNGGKCGQTKAEMVEFDLSLIFLRIVLEESECIDDIIKNTYWLRNKIKPLRKRLITNRRKVKLYEELRSLLRKEKIALKVQEEGVVLSYKGIILPGLFNEMAYKLWKPLSLDGQLRTTLYLKDRYNNALNLFDSLLCFV